MASPDRDPESQVESNEQTPLLNDRASEHRVEEESAVAQDEPSGWNWTKYAWRMFWAVVAAFLLAVFIKGWIDAGDVDVRLGLGPRNSSLPDR